MIALIRYVLAVLASPFKSKSRLEAENAALRQQLIVLRRNVKSRPSRRTTIAGRAASCRRWSSAHESICVKHPQFSQFITKCLEHASLIWT